MFTEILVVEWWGVFDRKWNFKQILVFNHVILMKTPDVHWARETQTRID